MSPAIIPHLRLLRPAAARGIGAASVEEASRGRIDRAGNLALEYLPVVISSVRIRMRDRIEKELRVGMHRIEVQLLLRRDLADAAEEHDAHSVRDKIDHGQVMADEQIRQAQFLW